MNSYKTIIFAFILLTTAVVAQDNVTLESKSAKITVSPQGGRIVAFTDKATGTQLVTAQGLCTDRELKTRLAEMGKSAYTLKPVDHGVEASYVVKDEKLQGIEYTKTYQVSDESPALVINLRIRNTGKKERAISPWVFNQAMAGGSADNNDSFFIPAAGGLGQIPLAKADKTIADNFTENPRAGWIAVMDSKKRQGLIALCEKDKLQRFCVSCGSKPGTMEWVYREIKLKSGEEWKTTFSFLPVNGLTSVAGASQHTVASLVRTEDESAQRVFLSVTSPLGFGSSEIIARTGDTELARTKVSLERGQCAALNWPARQTGKGELEVTIASDRGKEQILIPLADDNSPQMARIGHVSATLRGGPERFHRASEPIETPHVLWAKPLPGGPVRVLSLAPIQTQRDVIELAQRLDMKYSLVTFQQPLMDAAAVEEFLELLEGNTYDVILLGKVPVGLLPSEVQDALMDKVRKGAGIVSVNTSSTIKTGEALNIKGDGTFLEAVLPLHLLPDKCRPSVKVGECGKGKCVNVNYPARVSCLTPEVPIEQVDYRDWECYLELICRAVLWSAQRESNVQLKGACPAATTDERIADQWHTTRLTQVTQPSLVRDKIAWEIKTTEETFPLETWRGYGAKIAVDNGKLKISKSNLDASSGFGAGVFDINLEKTPILEVKVASAKEWSLFAPDCHFEKTIATLQPKTSETGTKRYDLRTFEGLRNVKQLTLGFSTFGEKSTLVLNSMQFLRPDGTPPAEKKKPQTYYDTTGVVVRMMSATDADVLVTAMYHGSDYYENIEKREQRVSLKKDNESLVTFPLLNLCGGKAHAVDLIVRNSKGESLAFATASYEVTSPILIPVPEAEGIHNSDATVIVKMESKTEQRDARLCIALSDMHGHDIGTIDRSIKIPAGKSEQRLSIPIAHSGNTIGSVRLSLPDAKEVTLEKNSYIITSLASEKEFYRHGDKVVVIARVENKAQERKTQSVISFSDMYGRLLAKSEGKIVIPTGVSEHRFELPTDLSLTTLNRARLSISDDKGLLMEEDTYVYLPEARPAWDDYLVSTSQFEPRNTYIRPYVMQVAREIGIEGMVIPLGYSFEVLKQAAPIMYWGAAKVRAFGYNFKGEETSTARKPCLSDPEVRQKITTAYEELGTTLRRYGPLSLASLEDESELSGARYTTLEVCTSEFCTKRYHDWLQNKYRTIDALNTEWSTTHQSFDEIKQITYKEARNLANPAQWVDWRTFMEDVWIDGLLLTRKGVKKNYPEIRKGFSNTFGEMPFSGWDFEKASANEDFSIEYPTVIFKLSPPKEENAFEEDAVDMSTVIRQKMDIRRSFLREDCPMPGWLWYDRSEQGAEFKPWWMAFLGTKGCTPWGPCSLGVQEGAKYMSFWAFIHPSLALTTSSTWLASGIHDLTRGVGKIFVDYERIVSPVAVLYSQPSMHVAWDWSDVEKAFYPETTSLYAWYYKSRVNVTRMLRELGFAYRYVGTSQIEAGDLKNYKILFLPCSLCLSDDTLKQIRQFAENGGIVVADIGTGATDEHGKPLPQREAIQTLFGIERKEICRKIEPAVLKIGGGKLEVPNNLRLAGMDSVTPHAEAVAARENGGAAIIVNDIGKGKTIYLNGFLGYNLPSRLFMRNILALARISTPVRITSGGSEHMGYECTTFRQGDIEILGILRLREEDDQTTVKLGSKGHLYDVRAGKYLGLTDAANFDLTHKAAAVLAVMPYEITGMDVKTSTATVRPGKKLEIKARVLTSESKPGDHVLRMEVFEPSGKLSSAYTDNVLASRGKFSRTIQTALNEQTGRWRVVFTDVISGKKAEKNFDIGQP